MMFAKMFVWMFVWNIPEKDCLLKSEVVYISLYGAPGSILVGQTRLKGSNVNCTPLVVPD